MAKQQGFINSNLRMVLLVVLFFQNNATAAGAGTNFSTFKVKTLPGFSGPLPFNLQTGYVTVEDVELFYYFTESERNPDEDPLLLWLTGGPGCSALSGLVFEIGPLRFQLLEYNGTLPTLLLNPHSWTKVASIIFLDGPVGTGFSYSRTYHGSITSDTTFAHQASRFLSKWLLLNPRFLKNPLYIAGDSYSGMVVPPIITHILTSANEAAAGDKWEPTLNLKGYLLGNPGTDSRFDFNSRIKFAHRMGLISDELYKSAKWNCRGEYVKLDPSNIQCMQDLQAISKCTERIKRSHILEPQCTTSFRILESLNEGQRFLHQKTEQLPLIPPDFPQPKCRGYNSFLCNIWANDISVQKALHAWKGEEFKEWIRCNESLHYIRDISSTIMYHQYLNARSFPAIIYSGDHDMVIPYLGTLDWIKSMNLTVVEKWRPWLVDGQVAGYTERYVNGLTFATVKGGGHTAPEYNPRECFAMFERWIFQQPL